MANQKKSSDQVIEFLRKDIFAIIWVIFIVVIIYLTFFGKEYVKDMIVVSILFLAFILLEPMVRMAHGSKITQFISGGKDVPPWKRFPVFFVVILIVFAIKHSLEIGLDLAFTVESVNIVLVAFWLAFLFLIFYLIFSKKTEVQKKRIRKNRKNT